MMRFLFGWFLVLQLLLDVDPDVDSDDDSEEGDPPKKGNKKPDASTIADNARRLLEKHKQNAVAAIALLMGENYEHRVARRTAEDRVKELEQGGAKAPEGGVVLTKEQATQWKSYTDLGTPEVIKQAMEERTNLSAEQRKQQREKLIADVAEVANFRAAPLARLSRKEDGTELVYEIKEETVEGEQIKVAYVTDGAETVTVADYAEKNWEEFLPALEGANSGEHRTNRDRSMGQFPGQERGAGASSRNNGNNPARGYLRQQYAIPGAKQQEK